MTQPQLHPQALAYLARLRQSAGHLPPQRRAELMSEIEEYLVNAIPPGATDHDALAVLERLGPPGDIVEAEQPRPQAVPDAGVRAIAPDAAGTIAAIASARPAGASASDPRTWREWAAVILLPLGGIVAGLGWIAGLICLWSSQRWTTRDKLIGTLVVPGGIATGLAVVLIGAAFSTTRNVRSCFSQIENANSFQSASAIHCHSGGQSSHAVTLEVILAALLVAGSIASAIYLARRARTNPIVPGTALA